MGIDPVSAGISAGGSLLSGLLSSLLGGGTAQFPPGFMAGTKGLKGLLGYYQGIMNTPGGGAPGEAGAASEATGNLATGQQNSLQQFLAAQGANGGSAPGAPDALKNFSLGATGQQAGLQAALQQMFNDNRWRAAQGIQNAGSSLRSGSFGQAYISQPPNLGAMFGGLAQQAGYASGRQSYQPAAAGGTLYGASAPASGSYYGPGGQDWGDGPPPNGQAGGYGDPTAFNPYG